MKIKNTLVCILFALFVFGGMTLCIFVKTPDYSQSERRELADFPELSVSTLVSGKFMQEFEKYTTDRFPFRDGFRSIKAFISYNILSQKDNNGVYVQDGFISKLDYPYNSESVKYAADRFSYIYNKYLQKSNGVYLSVIPDKNVFLAEKAGVLNYDENMLIDDLKEQMPYAEYIDISDTLGIDSFYKTDTHWSQDRITGTADRLAQGLSVTIPKEYKTNTSEHGFYGVLYGQAALDFEPDTVKYLTNPVIDGFKVRDGQNDKDIPVYDTSLLSGRDPYEAFLSGSLSIVTIENPACDNGKELVIFRDSFTSSIAPLIAQGYSKTTLVDIRYITPDYVSSLVNFDNADVLFMYSTSVLNNSETIK